MPYKTNRNLPDRVRKNLPPGAQTIFRKAFNNAYEKYLQEATAFKVAWRAVKKAYRKDLLTGKWARV